MSTIVTKDKLYKKDSKGRLRVWWTQLINDDEDGVSIVTHSGLKDGTIKTSHTKPKGTKTMNPEQHGRSKVQSAFDKKLKSGYFPTEQEALDYKSTKVMIIHKWQDHKHRMRWPAFIQPKLDGVCAKFFHDAEAPAFISRENNKFEKLDHMAKELNDYLATLDLTGTRTDTMDSHGELYAHGHHVSEIVEAIKGDNKEVLDKLRFYIFDYMGPAAERQEYGVRLRVGSKYYDWSKENKPFVPIKTLVAHNEDEVEAITETFIAQGFEGSVVSNSGGVYMYDRRTYDKLKNKHLDSAEFEIVGTKYESNGDDKLILFRCRTKDGLTFDVRPAWNHTKRKNAYEANVKGLAFAGKMATVEYRGMTKYKVPFHPVLVTVRDYE